MIRKRGKNVRKIEEISGDGCRCACYIGNDSDTRLIAPDKGEKVSNQASYPYIVIKTELSEMPVVFE